MKLNIDPLQIDSNQFIEVVDDVMALVDSNGAILYAKDSDGYEYWKEYRYGEIHKFDRIVGVIHHIDSDGYEFWYDYDKCGTVIHYKDSNHNEWWYNIQGDKISREEYDEIHEKEYIKKQLTSSIFKSLKESPL